MNTIACEKHLDINRFTHALSVLLSEQTGMDVTVTYQMKGGGNDGRTEHTGNEKALGSSSQAS